MNKRKECPQSAFALCPDADTANFFLGTLNFGPIADGSNAAIDGGVEITFPIGSGSFNANVGLLSLTLT
ncbi:MAG: hypothetical protein AAF665_12415 [Pseudomonadota bacterium]